MKKKKIIIGVIIALLLIVILGFFVFFDFSNNEDYSGEVPEAYKPEYMTLEEKASFSLPEDSKIQVLKRNEEGTITVYKIIREEGDEVFDIEAIDQPVDPRYQAI